MEPPKRDGTIEAILSLMIVIVILSPFVEYLVEYVVIL